MMKDCRRFRRTAIISILACWSAINPVLAQDGLGLELTRSHPTQIHVACEQPLEKICGDFKAAVESRTNLMLIGYEDMNPSALTASLSTKDGRRSEVAAVHVFGADQNFTIRSGVPFPEISRKIEYWSNAISAMLADAVASNLGE